MLAKDELAPVEVDDNFPVAKLKRRFQRVIKAGTDVIAQPYPVDDDIDTVLFIFVQFYFLVDVDDLAVNPDFSESFPANQFQCFFVHSFLPENNRTVNINPRSDGIFVDFVEHLLDRLRRDRNIVTRAMRDADAGV